MKRVEYLVYSRSMSHLEAQNFENVDRLIFFSVSPDKDGNVFNAESTKDEFAEKLKNLKELLSVFPDKEIYLGIGSLDELLRSGPLDEMTNHPFNVFLDAVKNLVIEYNFSGVDLDWEGHNMTLDDYTHAVYCLQMESVTGKPASVSIGYYQDNTDNYFLKASRSACESINIQCYADLEVNTRDFGKFLPSIISNLDKYGISKSKVNIGIPLYVSSEKEVYTRGWKDYVTEGGNPCLDKGYSSGKEVGTNSLCTVATRVRQVSEHGFNGIFTWEMTLDFPYSYGVSIGRVIDANNT